jgi:hypothetical protein
MPIEPPTRNTARVITNPSRPGALWKLIWCRQSADDRSRLKHTACLESAIFADGIPQPDEVTSGNAEVDTALAQGPVWISKGGNLQLLGLYESRIQRRFEKDMVKIRILQADRKATVQEMRSLREARKQFQDPHKASKIAA